MKTSEQIDTIQATETAHKFGHTPGPWHAHGCAIYQADNWQDGRNTGGRLIGGTDPENSDDLPDDQDHANAHLIAAAPELLAALVRLEEGVRLWMSKGVEDRDMEAARAAIAKAKGQL